MGVTGPTIEISDEQGTIILTVELTQAVGKDDTIHVILPGLTMEADPDTWQMKATIKERPIRWDYQGMGMDMRIIDERIIDNKINLNQQISDGILRDTLRDQGGDGDGGRIRRGWERNTLHDARQGSCGDYTWSYNDTTDMLRYRNNKTGHVSNVTRLQVEEHGGPRSYAAYLEKMEGINSKWQKDSKGRIKGT